MSKLLYKIPLMDSQPACLACSIMASSDGANGLIEDSTVVDYTQDDSFWSL